MSFYDFQECKFSHARKPFLGISFIILFQKHGFKRKCIVLLKYMLHFIMLFDGTNKVLCDSKVEADYL